MVEECLAHIKNPVNVSHAVIVIYYSIEMDLFFCLPVYMNRRVYQAGDQLRNESFTGVRIHGDQNYSSPESNPSQARGEQFTEPP